MRKLFRHTLVALCLLVPATAITTISTAPPASAHHAWPNGTFSHFKASTYPRIRTPTCYYWGNSTNYCQVVEEAAYYWQDRGFDRGFTGPLPTTGYTRCDNNTSGSINICFVSYGDPLLEGHKGIAKVYNFGNLNGDYAHTHSAQIFICGTCTLDEQRILLRHEIGHALGLDHHLTNPGCMMHDPIYVMPWEGCADDINHLRSIAQSHYD